MIVISFPTGCGGHFLGAVTALIFKQKKNKFNLDNGSMHLTTHGNGYRYAVPNHEIDGFPTNVDHLKSLEPNEIVIVHIKDIKLITDTYPNYKVIAVILDKSDLDLQQHNFLTKTIPFMWSESWYNIYRAEWYPDFDPDISKIPKPVIDEILSINRKQMQEYEYVFPDDMTNVLCVNYRELLFGDTLLKKIKEFFKLDNIDESVYTLVDDYRKIQTVTSLLDNQVL
jgi:hypothetical protein